MLSDDPRSRRRVLRLGGIAAATTLVAGCSDEGPGEGGDGTGDEVEDGDEPGGGDEDAAEDAEDEDEAGDDGDDSEAIEAGTTILFDAQSDGWEGLEPDAIESETNPTLVLEADGVYEIGWEDGDGSEHNIEIRTENDERVDDLETEVTDDPDDDQILEFTASEETAQYICQVHQSTMVGEIELE